MNPKSKATGLRYWMARVLEECGKVSVNFSADPVHDLRVALRRCRSMADGMMAMDPDPNWKEMKKAGKPLFQKLGELRDVQIMMEWIEKLELVEVDSPLELVAAGNGAAGPGLSSPLAEVAPSPARALLRNLERREAELKRDARVVLEGFNRKQWRQWTKYLPARAGRIRAGSLVFKHLALERWTSARHLHTVALRNRSQVAFHTLRIGIKRFRYIVENFLPVEHEQWGNDLKHLQDLLGELHDLDVLWATTITSHVLTDEKTRREWHDRLTAERTRRIDEYRTRTTGPESLWNTWRGGLPQGEQIQEIATRRMKLWAKAMDPDFAHAERVARLSLQLYDGLVGLGTFAKTVAGYINVGARESGQPSMSSGNPRSALYAAALLHDVGKVKGKKGHHKESQELIKKHETPLGWEEAVMRRAASVARFHAGALPTGSHKSLRDLLADEQRLIISLSAILRLANAFDCAHDGHIRRIAVEKATAAGPRKPSNGFQMKAPSLGPKDALVISAEGYDAASATAQAVAAERFLLERILRRPVFVQAARR